MMLADETCFRLLFYYLFWKILLLLYELCYNIINLCKKKGSKL